MANGMRRRTDISLADPETCGHAHVVCIHAGIRVRGLWEGMQRPGGGNGPPPVGPNGMPVNVHDMVRDQVRCALLKAALRSLDPAPITHPARSHGKSQVAGSDVVAVL